MEERITLESKLDWGQKETKAEISTWHQDVEEAKDEENEEEKQTEWFDELKISASLESFTTSELSDEHEESTSSQEQEMREAGLSSPLAQELQIIMDMDKETMPSSENARTELIDLQRKHRQLELRASLAEAKHEELFERLLQAESEKSKALAQLAERSSLESMVQRLAAWRMPVESPPYSVDEVTQQTTEQSANTIDDETVDHGAYKALEDEVTTLKEELSSSRTKLAAAVKDSQEWKEKLHSAETFLASCRKEYEETISALRRQMEQTGKERQRLEQERTVEREKQMALLKERVSAEQREKEEWMAKVDTLKNENHGLKVKVQQLEHAHAELSERYDKSQLEIATIKIDLATRRSEEDDLIARLQQQALEFNAVAGRHSPRQNRSYSLNDSQSPQQQQQSWSSWFGSFQQKNSN